MDRYKVRAGRGGVCNEKIYFFVDEWTEIEADDEDGEPESSWHSKVGFLNVEMISELIRYGQIIGVPVRPVTDDERDRILDEYRRQTAKPVRKRIKRKRVVGGAEGEPL